MCLSPLRWLQAAVTASILSLLLTACNGEPTEDPSAGDTEHDSTTAADVSDTEQQEGDADDGDLDDGAGDRALEAEGDTDVTDQPVPPDQWGPFEVGTVELAWRDPDRGGPDGKEVTTRIWYPAGEVPEGTARVKYLVLIEGNSYPDAPPDRERGPYPLVLFSHGNQGINFQSFSFTSVLASHGFIVAAPNHEGNTIADSPSDEEMAEIAYERPNDMAFVYNQLVDANADPESPFYQIVDTERVAISGHSFGGYTALLLAGGVVDVDAAIARCEAGIEGDVFCPSIAYWPAGAIMVRPANMAHLSAALAFAPGGYAAFADDGLAPVSMPTMVMGGEFDEFTRNDLRPIYEALPAPKYKLEIAQMGHMGFTDICRVPGVEHIEGLAELCQPELFLSIERSFEIINPFAIAFLRRYLKDELWLDEYLSTAYADTFPEAELELMD